MAFGRKEILRRLKRTVAGGRPIIIAGAGTGISAKFEEAGGVDLIILYNSGKFRMAGQSSIAGLMPYGDANAIVMEIANEVLQVIKKTPVLAGVCGTDPFRSMAVFLKEIKEIGFSGVQNFPTVSLYDGIFRRKLDDSGISFDLEVDMIKKAHELNLFTVPYAFNADEARSMAEVGADIIVAHLGPTVRGANEQALAFSLEEAAHKVQEICEEAQKANPDIMCLCHGGPIAEPRDAEYILQQTTGIHGFCGASSMERFPTEVAIKKQIRKFKAIKI
jgi:predicted TIM-barrel enzyme